jgi:hypothetical protein
MKTTPVTFEDLQSSVIAVPPLCRNKDLSLAKSQNSRLIKHMYKGGIRTLLYGGNANLYNIAPSEYHSLLKMLVDVAPEDMWIVPSVGPMYGTAMDQAKILSEFAFPTAMLLPTLFPSKPAGVATAIRHFVEKSGIKAVLYIKDGSYITPELAAELVNDGLISWIKYAIVEPDPKKDPYLKKLIKLVDTKLIVSGIGEQLGHRRSNPRGIRRPRRSAQCPQPHPRSASRRRTLRRGPDRPRAATAHRTSSQPAAEDRKSCQGTAGEEWLSREFAIAVSGFKPRLTIASTEHFTSRIRHCLMREVCIDGL